MKNTSNKKILIDSKLTTKIKPFEKDLNFFKWFNFSGILAIKD